MNRTNEQKLVDSLRTALVAMEEVEVAAKALLTQEDVRNVRQVISEAMHTPLSNIHDHIEKRLLDTRDSLERLGVILYLRDLEAINPNTKWRAVFDETKYVIRAVTALRTDFVELSVHEAKLVVEAYRDNLIK